MSDSDLLPIVIIGGGGHAAVIADILLRQNRTILAVVSPDEISHRKVFTGMNRLVSDDQIRQFDPETVRLVNGIGMIPRSKFRQQVNDTYLALDYEFETVIANEAIVSPYAEVGPGVQIFPGAIVQSGAVLGAHSIINTSAVIEHDCQIGAYNHIAPRATLCGRVRSESAVYVGAGATVIHNISLAKNSIVTAGTTVVSSLDELQITYPARAVTRSI
ncbi:acetyltransferase [Litoribacillus peritrichatus]|uniref:Acetyltransferase n=1 Tax=Litoribacillus peritrichatus TaxID=718191 RepID=A0ABP7M1U5_9GAMM